MLLGLCSVKCTKHFAPTWLMAGSQNSNVHAHYGNKRNVVQHLSMQHLLSRSSFTQQHTTCCETSRHVQTRRSNDHDFCHSTNVARCNAKSRARLTVALGGLIVLGFITSVCRPFSVYWELSSVHCCAIISKGGGGAVL